MNRPVLVAGAAGFIGSAVAEKLLADGVTVIGIDNLNDYYAPAMLEIALGHTAIQQFESMQPGDVEAALADTSALEAWVGFRPETSMAQGVAAFADWYRQFYGC